MPAPHTLLRPPRLLNFVKGFKSPILFLCIKDRRQYVSRVLPILAVVWKDAIAFYSCFEACSVNKRILQRSGEGNQLTENNDNQGEAKEVEEHNQNMAKEDYPNLLKNLFD